MNPLGNGRPMQPNVNPMTNQIVDAIRFAQSFGSPEQYMQHLQKNNPQMFQKITEMQRTIQDPSAYANRVLAERGINPAQIADMLQRK